MYDDSNPQTALVAAGNTLVRLENDTQIQVSVQRPRDEVKILTAALKELEIYPSMAEEALYIKPVGKNAETGKMSYAEGLSIRTAESLANRWTNSAYGCEILGEDENVVNLAAVFLDYENNTRHVISARVPKSYKQKRGGGIVYKDPDKLELSVRAEQSKALREVILRSLPAGLKREYEIKVRNILKGGKVENRKASIVAKFADISVNQATLEAHIGKPMAQWEHEDLVTLFGIFTAMRDGELTREAAFNGGSAEEEKKDLKDTVVAEEKKEPAQAKSEGNGSAGTETKKEEKAAEGCQETPKTCDWSREVDGKIRCDKERKDCYRVGK
jgi:hypothetical protein